MPILQLMTVLPLLWGFAGDAPSAVLRWDFETPAEARSWAGEGIEASRTRDGVLEIFGREELQLVFPPGRDFRPEENRYLKIRFKTRSPRYLAVIWEPARAASTRLPSLSLPPIYDGNFHTRWIDLSHSPEWRGEIKRVGLVFSGRPGWIEIDSIELGPFSLGQYLRSQWEEFVLPWPMTLALINSLPGPSIFNRPLIVWMNLAALAALIAGTIAYFRCRRTFRPRIVIRIGLAFLIIWLLYDLRETYSQYRMVDEIYRTYLKPPPEAKTYPPLGDFYRFVEFCRRHIPEGSVYELLPLSYWPFDCRLKYFLCPSVMFEPRKPDSYFRDGSPVYYVTYNSPTIELDPATGQIVDRGNRNAVLAANVRLVARCAPGSFIAAGPGPITAARTANHPVLR